MNIGKDLEFPIELVIYFSWVLKSKSNLDKQKKMIAEVAGRQILLSRLKYTVLGDWRIL